MDVDSFVPTDECRAVAERLLAYLDDEATEADAERVAVHIDICALCGLAAETVLALKASTAQHAQGVDPDPEAVERLRQFARTLQPPASNVTDS